MASKRTFEDVVSTVSAMTGRRPNRSTDNLGMTSRLAERLGLSPALTRLKVVHVAGTKGKGTTSTYCSHLLREAYGKRVGLFTSPHLFDVRERIQVNNELISKEKFTEYFFDIHDRLALIASSSESNYDRDSASRANFFRFMFLLSLYAFEKEQVEFAVYEVGIGGRIDSTNIFPSPVACGITTLGMDHTELLGDTVEKIAFEKAGIIKPDVPCFSSPQRFHPSTRAVLQAEGRKVGAPVIFLDDDVISPRRWPVLAMGGSHYVENSRLGFALARTAVGIPVPQPIVRREWDVLEKVRIEGRSEMIRVVDPVERDPRRERTASLLMRAIELREAEDRAAEAASACVDLESEHGLGNSRYQNAKLAGGEGSSSSLIPMKDLAFYLDGAHNPESMQVMSEWFFSLPPRGLIPIPSRPASSAGSNHSPDSLPPTPPLTPRTAAGVSKVLPSHLVVTAPPLGSAKGAEECAVTQVRTTILFYCTRTPREMLRYFMPYEHLIDKVVFCLIPNPKNKVEGGKDSREAAEDDRLALAAWTEAWRNLYREIPCYAVPDAFESFADCLEIIRNTAFRTRPALANTHHHHHHGHHASQGKEELLGRNSIATADKRSAAECVQPYPSNLPIDIGAVRAIVDKHGAEAVHVEDRVLVTGSVLFVGDTLKIMHDVGLFPDN